MAGAHVLVFNCTDLLPLLLASLLHAVSLECDNYIIIICINTSSYLGSIENILGCYSPPGALLNLQGVRLPVRLTWHCGVNSIKSRGTCG